MRGLTVFEVRADVNPDAETGINFSELACSNLKDFWSKDNVAFVLRFYNVYL
jgi:hypothetical protein